ncbi:MAG TPA: hypothetical protein VJ776_07095 [Thermoanaerobaculia bacterium]|nr:hypothetical protein [Thermoanaerobaculia bacterium]
MTSRRPGGRRIVLVPALIALLLAMAPRGSGQTSPAVAPAASGRLFQGPAKGVGGTAAAVSLSSIPQAVRRTSIGAPVKSFREHEIPRVKNPPDLPPPLAPAGSNEVEDGSRAPARLGARPLQVSEAASPIVSFRGLDYTGSVPPDPIVAAGPSHVVAAVNSEVGVFSKSGALLNRIDADSWFSNVLPNVGALGGTFDPKVLYDQAAGRWIIAYLATDNKTESWVLLSVSSTSDPTGNWCNIPLHGDRNGNSPSGNWSDYDGLGLDDQALYITTNQFQMTTAGDGKFQYARIRIIPKSQLYGGCVSPSYFDFWDLTDPASTNERVFTLRAALTYGTPGVEYLVNNSPFETSTYFTLWSLTNPLSGSPTLTARNVPVAASTAPPNADQLDGTGGTRDCPAPCLIDTGDGRLLDLVYRNGSLWTSHAVAGGTGDAYSRARYVRIGVTGPPTVLEDVSFGADGCWYYYPAVAPDQNSNLGMVFTRSCTSEYASIRYTGRATTDTTLQGSTLVKSGEANYLNPASGLNRWGDYSGAAVDPADPTKIWFFGEYAASPANTWGTWAGQVAITGAGTGPCVADANALCLNNSRFRVTASFQSSSGSGTGTAVSLTGDTGYFWFFTANNVEIVIKVVDGRAANNRFWVFAGGLTNVNVVITVTDTQTGEVRTYVNPQGVAFQPIQDTSAFAGLQAPVTSSARSVGAESSAIFAGLTSLIARRSEPFSPAAACVANATTLCLNNGRFSVQTVWTAPGSGTGSGQAVALTGDTGYFWFFSPNNVEMVAKVVTGCAANSRYWVFAGGLTDVSVVTTVTDTQTGIVRTYFNPQGTAFQPIQDTNAYPCP